MRRPLHWIDVAGGRYVVVPTYALDAPEPIGYVGIVLTLYADLWLQRQARRRSPREEQDR